MSLATGNYIETSILCLELHVHMLGGTSAERENWRPFLEFQVSAFGILPIGIDENLLAKILDIVFINQWPFAFFLPN